MERIRLFCLLVVTTVLTHATAALAHDDISPTVEAGMVVTNGYDDALAAFSPHERVFGFDFQEDPLDPYFIQDPGFNALANNGLPPTDISIPNSGQLLFDVLGDLQYWNGTGSVAFGAVPGGESLLLHLGSQNRTVGTGIGFQTGFSLGVVANDGSLHKHLESTLQPGGASMPADGIYLLALQLRSVNTNPAFTIADSLPFWVVYNNGLTETVHDEAIDYVQTTLVPEPSTFVLAGLGALAGLLTWHRRRGAAYSERLR